MNMTTDYRKWTIATGIIFSIIFSIFFALGGTILYEGDYKKFNITPMEKWGDLNNADKITDFCKSEGYETYTMKRYSNHREYPLILSEGENIHYVSNPDDAYIVCIKSNGDEKKFEYRDLKTWILENEEMI